MSGRPREAATEPGRLASLRDALTVLPRTRPVTHRVVRTSARTVLWAALRAGLRVRVEGERLPGPAIVVSNHPHVIDGLIVLFADPTLRPVARWHRLAVARVGMWVSDCIVTTTGSAAPPPPRGAFAQALAHVRDGGRVWIAPEGGWQPQRTLRPPRTGAVRMAAMAGAPIQVLGVLHEEHPGPRLTAWRPWRRPGIVLRWGPVVTATGQLDEDIDRMMTAIAGATGTVWAPDTCDAPDPAARHAPTGDAPADPTTPHALTGDTPDATATATASRRAETA